MYRINTNINELISQKNCQCCNYDKIIMEKNEKGLYTIKLGYKIEGDRMVYIVCPNSLLLNLDYESLVYRNDIGQEVAIGILEID